MQPALVLSRPLAPLFVIQSASNLLFSRHAAGSQEAFFGVQQTLEQVERPHLIVASGIDISKPSMHPGSVFAILSKPPLPLLVWQSSSNLPFSKQALASQ